LTQAIDQFLDALDPRLDKGAREYRNRSMTKKVTDVERELKEELLDLVGWTYVMWSQAAHRAAVEGNEEQLRGIFFANLRHRLMRNDRSKPAHEPASGAPGCMVDLEILAMDLFEHAEQVKRRLFPIARAIEVARWISPPMNGRRGGASSPRTSD
tara:strand:+ start:35519 stop:35983 length:465 start_codon:yes stop_codon:yes gene_type:complete